jgi:hypothetical protein
MERVKASGLAGVRPFQSPMLTTPVPTTAAPVAGRPVASGGRAGDPSPAAGSSAAAQTTPLGAASAGSTAASTPLTSMSAPLAAAAGGGARAPAPTTLYRAHSDGGEPRNDPAQLLQQLARFPNFMGGDRRSVSPPRSSNVAAVGSSVVAPPPLPPSGPASAVVSRRGSSHTSTPSPAATPVSGLVGGSSASDAGVAAPGALLGAPGAMSGAVPAAGMHAAAAGGELPKQYNIAFDSLHFKETVGEGSFGVVRRAIWRGMQVAVKLLKVTHGSSQADLLKELQVCCLQGAATVGRFAHSVQLCWGGGGMRPVECSCLPQRVRVWGVTVISALTR